MTMGAGGAPGQCRCPRLPPDVPDAARQAYWACLDRGEHDWIYDGVTCCLEAPRNWRQVCHCGAQRWTEAPPSRTPRLDRLRAEMSTVPILARG
jgi:hypothetical protein